MSHDILRHLRYSHNNVKDGEASKTIDCLFQNLLVHLAVIRSGEHLPTTSGPDAEISKLMQKAIETGYEECPLARNWTSALY